MSALRLLIKPTLFTVGVCGTCFCGAAILQYENGRSKFSVIHNWVSIQKQRSQLTPNLHPTTTTTKYLEFRQRINSWTNQLSMGQKIACSTIFINSMVLLGWKIRGLQPIMQRFFLCLPPLAKKTPLSPMILSCFSHSMPLHFAFNMYALYSFTPFATALLGPEQLVALFISAGAVSSLTSIAYKLITRSHMPSLGASGALLGVIGYICIKRPDAELLLLFIPIAAGTAIKGIMALDTIGMIARWRYLDHAAHLGGSLFGVWYATEGEKLFYQHRKAIIDHWLRLRNRFN